MRIILRPLLFLQSFFYLLLGKLSSVRWGWSKSPSLQEVSYWAGPSSTDWRGSMSGREMSWAMLQWHPSWQVQTKYRFHNFSFHLNQQHQGAIIFFLGFLGLITSCSKSYSWSYCYSIIILVFIIIQCLLAILTVLFRWGCQNNFLFLSPSFRYEVEQVIISVMKQTMRYVSNNDSWMSSES